MLLCHKTSVHNFLLFAVNIDVLLRIASDATNKHILIILLFIRIINFEVDYQTNLKTITMSW